MAGGIGEGFGTMRMARNPRGHGGQGGTFGMTGGPPPQDILILLAVIFGTFVLQFFGATAILPALLRLGPMVFRGALWQLVTYAFVGFGPASLWFLLSMLILFWFGRDVFVRLGRKNFWSLVVQVVAAAGIAAALVRGAGILMGLASPNAFVLMQGQFMLITVMIAAFATLYGQATIMLFFVLPIKARWFLALEVLFGFMGFLNTKDFAGFVGLCVAVGLTWALLQPGGIKRVLANIRLRFRRRVTEAKLARLKRKRKFNVIDGDGDGGWVH